MLKYSNFAIIASFFGLWIDSFLSHQIQLWIGFLLIFSFGILHGANDLTLIENINAQKKTTKYWKVLFYYITIVLSGALLFYTMPWVALMLFIIVSGYHFGEQQWNKQIILVNHWLKFYFQLTYGLLILFLLFVFHEIEVQQIVFAITTIENPLLYFLLGLKIITLAFLILGILLYLKCKEFQDVILKELFYLLVFAILFKVSSLIWGFALYFIFWHSIPSMQDQTVFIYGKFSLENFKKYFLTAYIYWIASLAGIALLYFIFKEQKIFNALFFSFLASITFPHVLVIQKMFGKNNV